MTAYELVLSRLLTDTPTRRFLEAVLQNPSWVVTIIAGCEHGVGCIVSYDPDVGVERHMMLLAELSAVLPASAAMPWRGVRRVNVVEHGNMRTYVVRVKGTSAAMLTHATVFDSGWHLVVAVKRLQRPLSMTIYT